MKTPSTPNKTPMIGLNTANHSAQSTFLMALPFACMMIHLLSLGRSRLIANSPITKAHKIDIVIMMVLLLS
jgi:hypothetical protein